MDREVKIVRTSVVNIVGNVSLAITKGATGIATGSIAIILDAVNSLMDALSSVIAIIGTKLAGRPADHEHPFGYGRAEHLTSITIAALILATGFSSLIESIKSIIHPTEPNYSIASIVVVAIAAAVKFGLGGFLLQRGKKLDSGSLVGSGTDSMMDGCVSTATCVAAILYRTIGLKVEAYLAALIALLIINSGIGLLLETASKLLGERISPKIAEQVEQEARKVKEVRLANGLVLHDFGHNQMNGSIHVTVDGQMTVAEFDKVAREVQQRVFDKQGIMLSGVTPYADNSRNKDVASVRAAIARVVWGHEHVVELRGLYVDPATSTIRFDAVADFGTTSAQELLSQVTTKCQESCPGWSINARVIPDVGD